MFLSIAHDPSDPGHSGATIVMNPDWLNLDLARQWKQECLAEHGNTCSDTTGIAPEKPAWLIDVQQNCVVPGENCSSFVALSYVWGKHSRLRVDEDTITLLQIPGALVDNPEIATKLSPIVRHAMYLTSALEERYLWIDAICIVQGSGDIYDQLNRMGGFYSTAVVTIVAADGDSQSGLPGLEGVSRPRRALQKVIPFGKKRLVEVKLDDNYTLRMFRGSDYDRRGWTFQEYELSKRRLISRSEKLTWKCNSCTMHEDIVPGTFDQFEGSGPDLIAQGFSGLSFPYANKVLHFYNRRQFSYEEDALPAISGLLSIWSRTFTGGFLCGLPEMFFDRCLGWIPRSPQGGLRRRVISARGQETQAPDNAMAILPSWTWLGWQGAVKMDGMGYEAVRYNDRVWEIDETIPTTIWYTSNKAHGGKIRRIRSTWYENRDTLYKDPLWPLPQGWSRVKDESPVLFPNGCGKGTFEHAKLPGVHWYYPFPVVDVGNAPQVMPEQTRYLFCRTQSTRLFASCVEDGNTNVLSLHPAPNAGSIGELQSHNQDIKNDLLSTQNVSLATPRQDTITGQFIEVVIIYELCIHTAESPCLQERKLVSGKKQTRHSYAILWIEWEGGIAYRKGIGRVDKASWGLSGPKEIDLVLG